VQSRLKSDRLRSVTTNSSGVGVGGCVGRGGGSLEERSAEAAFPGANGKIAFTRIVMYPPEAGAAEVFTMNPNASNATRLTDKALVDWEPAWSPDGRKIAFAKDPGPGDRSDSEIFVMNPDGSRQERLTDNTKEDYSPDWRPIVP
jgi:TolB protein